MVGLLNAETLFLFIFFVVPGIVTIRTYDLLVPTDRRNFRDQFVDVVAYSFLVLALLGGPYLALVNNRKWFGEGIPGTLSYVALLGLIILLITVVAPVAIAFGYYRLRTSEFLRGKITHPSPTSWDYFFEQGKVFWVRFHMKSGEKLGGFYGEGSFATSYPQPQQVYLTELYQLDNDGRIAKQVGGTLGAIINKEDCELIEFLELKEDQQEEEKQNGKQALVIQNIRYKKNRAKRSHVTEKRVPTHATDPRQQDPA